VLYLAPLVAARRRTGGLTVATLNCDLSIELAGALEMVAIETGIRQWAEDSIWSWSPEGIRLLKLHGSVDWGWTINDSGPGHLPQRSIRATGLWADDATTPAVVFGSRGKLRAGGPFLSLLAEFEKQIAGTDELIIVSYSFRDDHVNEVIRRWATVTDPHRLVVVDPGFPKPMRIWTLVATSEPNSFSIRDGRERSRRRLAPGLRSCASPRPKRFKPSSGPQPFLAVGNWLQACDDDGRPARVAQGQRRAPDASRGTRC
jgi:hypothetical protein